MRAVFWIPLLLLPSMLACGGGRLPDLPPPPPSSAPPMASRMPPPPPDNPQPSEIPFYKFIVTEAAVRTALRAWPGMSDYSINVHLSVDIPVTIAGQPMLVRLRQVNDVWEWYGARMLDPPIDGSPSEVIQWLQANKAPGQ